MKIIEELEGLVFGKIAIFKMVIELVKLETRLAGLSVFPLLINLSLLLIIAMSTWAIMMFLIGYGLFIAFANLLLASVLVFLLNLITLVMLLNYLSFNLKKMSFEKTRAFLSTKVEDDHGRFEKKDHHTVGNDRKKIKIPAS